MSTHPAEDTLSTKTSAMLRRESALTPLVLFMGFIGATLRYMLEFAIPTEGGFPYATLAINLFGCFVLELVNQYVGRRMHLPKPLVKSVGVGLIGAFTTLSAFSIECLSLLQMEQYGLAALYITVTIAMTFLASLAGHGACRMLEAQRFSALRKRRQMIHARYAGAALTACDDARTAQASAQSREENAREGES